MGGSSSKFKVSVSWAWRLMYRAPVALPIPVVVLYLHIERSDPYSYWIIKGDLGSGSYGKVHLVQNRQDKSEAAAKVAELEGQAGLAEFSTEIDILASCRHPNITRFLTAYFHENKLWIVIEKCDGGALGDCLTKRGSPLVEDELRIAGFQMTDAVAFLHAKKIMHRDINAANTLVSGDGLIKLADFGVSAISKANKRNSFIGSPNWMAPEVVMCETDKKKTYTNACDIWSLGITLIELAEMQPPHHELHPVKVMLKITTGPSPKLSEPDRWSKDFPDLLYRMLKKEPTQRATALELLDHAFLRDQSEGNLMSLLA